MRKILHIDMDAFYASVEERDRPELRGRPVVVAWEGPRSVVCAASYAARRFGVRSAMPALTAARLCPEAVFIRPRFARYREVSRTVRSILLAHTPLVEPLSLDEAYLDVTHELTGLPSATATAEQIRREIREATGLTASAGVAPNKFLAKIASDWKKPDGLFVIRPRDVERFLTPLAVERLPGVGKATARSLSEIGIKTVGELRRRPLAELIGRFGRFGERLWELARGLDERPVEPERPTKSISAETTFPVDLPLSDLAEHLAELAGRVERAARKQELAGRTVVVKLKRSDFQIYTRRATRAAPIASAAELAAAALALLDRFAVEPHERFRLLGVGLAGFPENDAASQLPLF